MPITLLNKKQYEALNAIAHDENTKIPDDLELEFVIQDFVEYRSGKPTTTWRGEQALTTYERQDTMPEQYQRLHRAISDATGNLVLVNVSDILFLFSQFQDHSRPALEKKLAEKEATIQELIPLAYPQNHKEVFKPKRQIRKLVS